MKTRATIYAVTLNWNSYEDVCECVASLERSDAVPDKIIIVDNGSSDGSERHLEARYRVNPRVVLIKNRENEGFARAVNKGLRVALAEDATFVFLINGDAVVDPRCIGILQSAIDGDPLWGATSPPICYRNDPGRIWFGAGYFSKIRANVVAPDKNKLRTQIPQDARDVGFVSGCAVLLRTSMLRTTGLFDTEYFFYVEDVDLSMRALRHGFRLRYVPAAQAWHSIGDVATTRSSGFVMYHRARSNVIFFRKNFSSIYYCYALILHLIVYTPYRAVQALRGGSFRSSFLGWIRGTRDGIFSGRDRPAGSPGRQIL